MPLSCPLFSTAKSSIQICWLGVMAAAPLLLITGCASLPSRETPLAAEMGASGSEVPPESRFVKLTADVSTAHDPYPVWRTRSPGKPVLLLHPINGLSPHLLRLALEMETWGFRVYLPSLYGDPVMGEPAYGFDKGISMIKFLKQDERWNPVSTDTMGPIVDEVGALARWVSRKEGGRKIAVVGNSLTGMIPLAVLDEPSVRVAVLGQPATPALRMHDIAFRIPQSEENRRALSMSMEEWQSVERSLRRDSRKRIFGFHYVEDPLASVERFDELRERLEGAGLRNRFRAFVLHPPGDDYVVDRSDWVTSAETLERRKMLTPHSTYGDPESPEDREWFRAELKSALHSVSY